MYRILLIKSDFILNTSLIFKKTVASLFLDASIVITTAATLLEITLGIATPATPR